jgi:hypothetical protein
MSEQDLIAKAYVENALNVHICEPFAGLVVYGKSGVMGAFVVNNYDGRDAHLTVALEGRMSVAQMRNMARYIFQGLGCHRVTAVTRRGNERAVGALEMLGFRQEGVLREHFPDADGIVYGLLRGEQKIVRL